MLELHQSGKTTPLTLALFMCAFLASNCGKVESKTKAIIENIKFCEEPDASNLCETHATTFPSGITRVYASGDIKLAGENGTFDITWYEVHSSLETLGHKTILAGEDGTGKIAIDIFTANGLEVGTYRLHITFENEISEGEASSDFHVIE